MVESQNKEKKQTGEKPSVSEQQQISGKRGSHGESYQGQES